MVRWLLLLIFLGAAGAAGYFGIVPRNSYSSYSQEQLDQLRHEYLRPRTDLDTAIEAEVSDSLLRDEEDRRRRFFLSLGGAVLAGLGALLASAPRPRRVASDAGEEARLVAALGDPAVALEGARHKAAALLGVAPDAPPDVVEAALQAQLQARDSSRLEGLEPGLRQVALDHREVLVKARDLLLDKKPPLA